MKVILISGKAQHGKDTSAEIFRKSLEENGYRALVAHYADLLKYICRTFFGWDGQKNERGRQLLQHVGTDVIRRRAPDYWVNFLSEFLFIFSDEWDYVIIPDTRFPNEISVMYKAGFDTTHIRVHRGNFTSPLTEEQQRHPSETALDNTEPDFWLINDGSIEDLEQRITHWLKENVYDSRQ